MAIAPRAELGPGAGEVLGNRQQLGPILVRQLHAPALEADWPEGRAADSPGRVGPKGEVARQVRGGVLWLRPRIRSCGPNARGKHLAERELLDD